MHEVSMIDDVIYADDDQEDYLFFTLALDEIAVKVKLRHAVDGEALFVLLKQQVPDILFLDIYMPCKDGVSCLHEIRQDRRYDGMPVVMITGSLAENTVERTYRLSANLYLKKESTITDLATKLRNVFSKEWKNGMHYPALKDFVL